MSVKKVGLAATLVAGAWIAGPAVGGITGLGYEVVAVDGLDPAEFGDNWTVRIYAELSPGAQLNAVAGNSITNKVMSTSGTFYQDGFGGGTSTGNNCALHALAPTLAYDSWLTIGSACSDGTPFAYNPINAVGIDFAIWEAGGTLSFDNGTIFVTPDDPHGDPLPYSAAGCDAGTRDGVLVAQVTILGGPGTSVSMEALFQGREADGATNFQDPATITIFRPSETTDCNGNGVDDACDIENGTSLDQDQDGIPDECADCNDNGIQDSIDIADGSSLDCNGNGIPDECDLADGVEVDCNFNGIPDSCDIANGAPDCDGNGVIDSCDILNGAGDCDGNGVLDSCQLANGAADCNGNSILDVCDIASGADDDCDGNGTPDACDIANGGDANGNGELDACEYTAYRNRDTGATFDTFDDVSYASQNGDRIDADFEAINGETEVDFRGKALRVSVINGDFTQAADASLNLGAGSRLNGGSAVALNGDVRSTSSYAMLSASASMTVGTSGSVTVRGNSDLEFSAPSMVNGGEITVRSGGNLDLNLVDSFVNEGVMNMIGSSTLHAESFANAASGAMATSGTLYLTLDNAGSCQLTANTVLTGDLNNSGLTSAVAGQMYVLGDVNNTGQLVGDVGEGFRSSGGDLRVSGSFSAGADSSLILPAGWQLTVGRDLDLAISTSSNLVALDATIRMDRGLTASSTIEAMSEDQGEVLEGIDADNFAIGTLIIGVGNTVTVVDNHVNSGSSNEVLYVRNLNIEAGAALDANGRTVWVENLENEGTIVGDIIVIDPVIPCPGDLDGNLEVNIDDLLIVLSSFDDNDGGDLNGDTVTDIDDLLILLANFGEVCG